MLTLTLVCLAMIASAAEPTGPTVGIEGQLDILLPGTVLKTLPADPKEPVTVRIAGIRPHGSKAQYDLRYIGQLPGTYDLRKYLAREDGTSTDDLPAMPVQVSGVLPPQHSGTLAAREEQPLPGLGGYRWWMIGAGVLWLALLIPLWLGRRRQTTAVDLGPATAPVTMADRLRPLIAEATSGRLSADGLAQLERLLLAYWRERLALREGDPAAGMAQLRVHPEAGALLRALEEWLHRPAGQAPADLDRFLAPYAAVPVPPAGAGSTSPAPSLPASA